MSIRSGIRSCYDEGKRCAETLFFDYRRQHNMPIKVARIFNTYGPRMHPNDGRVVSSFIVQALQRQGHYRVRQRAADALVLLCRRSRRWICPLDVNGFRCHRSGQSRQSHRIHHPRPREAGHRLTGSRSRIMHHPLPQDDPRQRCPDISTAKNLLGWSPKIQLDGRLDAHDRVFRLGFAQPTGTRRGCGTDRLIVEPRPSFKRVGRIRQLAKSMVAVVHRQARRTSETKKRLKLIPRHP